jgi:hypothetical protein
VRSACQDACKPASLKSCILLPSKHNLTATAVHLASLVTAFKG